MAVYIDDFFKTGMGLGKMKTSHMIADTSDELLAMCDKIGIKRKWIQYKGTSKEHFDISLKKRKLAIQNGAIEMGMRDLVKIIKHR